MNAPDPNVEDNPKNISLLFVSLAKIAIIKNATANKNEKRKIESLQASLKILIMIKLTNSER